MNNSGIAAKQISEYYKIEAQEFLIILDDFNLEEGVLRLRKRGSDGGHNGLASIIYHLGTEEIPRLRIGIGKNENIDAIQYVLGEMKKEIRKSLIEKGVNALEIILEEDDLERAMGKINIRRVDD